MNRTRAVVLSFYVIAAAAGYCFSETVIQPGPTNGSDTYFGTLANTGGAPGDQFLMCGGKTNGDYYQSFIQFNDLSTGPLAANTSRAELWLYCANMTYDPAIQIHRNTSSWTEASLSYYSYPSIIYYNSFGALTSTGWRSVDITDLYKDWKNNTLPNYGIRLYPNNYNAAYNAAYFYSSNYTEDPTKRPKLVITPYVDPITTTLADLTVTDVQTDAWSRTVAAGSSINLTLTINNNSNLSIMTPYTIRIYFTYTQDTNPVTIATLPYVEVPGPLLSAYETGRSYTATINVPATVQPGTYFLVASIDCNNIIAESNEANNLTSSNSTLSIGTSAISSQLESAFAYPSPAYLSRGHTIKISGSLPNAYARVLSSSGRLLKTINPNNAGVGPEWDGKTDTGEQVSTGLYFIHVTDETKQTRVFTVFVYR